MLTLFPLFILTIDAARVIEMRIRMMALGRNTPGELCLMVTEKVRAMEEATAIMLRGGSSTLVMNNYCRLTDVLLEHTCGRPNACPTSCDATTAAWEVDIVAMSENTTKCGWFGSGLARGNGPV